MISWFQYPWDFFTAFISEIVERGKKFFGYYRTLETKFTHNVVTKEISYAEYEEAYNLKRRSCDILDLAEFVMGNVMSFLHDPDMISVMNAVEDNDVNAFKYAAIALMQKYAAANRKTLYYATESLGFLHRDILRAKENSDLRNKISGLGLDINLDDNAFIEATIQKIFSVRNIEELNAIRDIFFNKHQLNRTEKLVLDCYAEFFKNDGNPKKAFQDSLQKLKSNYEGCFAKDMTRCDLVVYDQQQEKTTIIRPKSPDDTFIGIDSIDFLNEAQKEWLKFFSSQRFWNVLPLQYRMYLYHAKDDDYKCSAPTFTLLSIRIEKSYDGQIKYIQSFECADKIDENIRKPLATFTTEFDLSPLSDLKEGLTFFKTDTQYLPKCKVEIIDLTKDRREVFDNTEYNEMNISSRISEALERSHNSTFVKHLHIYLNQLLSNPNHCIYLKEATARFCKNGKTDELKVMLNLSEDNPIFKTLEKMGQKIANRTTHANTIQNSQEQKALQSNQFNIDDM